MKKIMIKRRHAGHPWIFSNEIISQKEKIEPGEIVEIYHDQEFLGRGFYNPNSLIAVRQYSSQAQDFDRQFFEDAVNRAFAYRKQFITDNSFRLIFSEGDQMPGLIIDKYEENFVLQVHCYGMDLKKDLIIDSLVKFEPKFIYEKSDERLRKLEGLALKNGICYGKMLDLAEIKQDGIRLLVDIERGQKTGFFFDLRTVRERLWPYVQDKDILDLFCYSGSFALYAAKGGAKSVLGIDTSKSAIELAIQNAKINNFQQLRFECEDAFDFLRNDKNHHDVIILDPPSFTKSKKELNDARRGYKDINLQAMKRLKKDGVLITTCCSYHISEDDFLSVVNGAAADVGFNFRIIGRATQSLDHPILLSMPESHYLKAYFLQKI